MDPTSRNPLDEWYIAHQDVLGTPTDTLILTWAAALNANADAVSIEEFWEDWYGDRSGKLPDLVACIAYYGYSRLLIQGWKKLPIVIPEDQADAWRDHGFGATLDEFRGIWQAGVAGGFLELAGRDPEVTEITIKKQLHEKSIELDRLIQMPFERYTPQKFTDEELDESGGFLASGQHDYLDEPFALYEQLVCFSYGLQKLRLFCMTEKDEALHLPNRLLYESLLRIDLGKVSAHLDAVDPKLRKILRHLEKHRYLELNSNIAPSLFWWRHWPQKGQ